MEKIQNYENLLKYLVYKSREEGNPQADAFIAFLLNIQYDKKSICFYFVEKTQLSRENIEDIITNIKGILNAKDDNKSENIKFRR